MTAKSQEAKAQSSPNTGELTNPFGIYVHIPFCFHRCSYCDFFSSTQFNEERMATFTHALREEIHSASQYLASYQPSDRMVTSIFFGGGTPSLLPVPLLASVFEVISDSFNVGDNAEVTLEANPETVTPSFCESLRDSTPVNRMSVGAQSFQAKHLSRLERLSSAEGISSAVEKLRRVGYQNINLDLIFGIPGQSYDEIEEDLKRAILLGPTHLSAYNLTLKKEHPLFSDLPSDDEVAEQYEGVQAWLFSQGYEQYEISNYAKEGCSCLHNLLYWSGSDYLGVGPSASSRFFWGGKFQHRKSVAHLEKYMTSTEFSVVSFEPSSIQQTQLEAFFLEIRRNSGLDLERFGSRYGIDLTALKKYSLFIDEGLLVREGKFLRLSFPRGQLLSDLVSREIFD